MQDEINEKTVALYIKTGKLTAEVLQKAMKTVLTQTKKQIGRQPHGKQTLKQLMKQNTGVSNIEITKDNIKAFEHTAKKYGIDFALKKDATETPPRYVDHWPQAFKRNIGLLLFGDVGTGKSFAAGCIANALLDRDVPVLMTNFPTILARLCGTFGEDRTDFLDSLGDYDLLIIDDLGAERNTEYALEQMFSIIDSRYRCNKPLIVTTNLKLDELKRPPDLAHARIYDRILERCAPILFAGKNFREDNAASIKTAARQIITSTAVSHRQTATEKGEL